MKVVHSDERTQLLLNDRGKTHGNFYEQSFISQELKKMLANGVNWHQLTCVQRESLEMIVHKIARILSGDASHDDHWRDIQGYAQLVMECANSRPPE